METPRVKEQVWALADELNAALGVQHVQPHQQDATKKNMSLTNPEGERLHIKSALDGYQIALGTKPLVARMESFMERLTGSKPDGYNQLQQREPRWNDCDYAQVRKAAYFFADAPLPLDNDKTIEADLEAIARRPGLKSTQRETLIQARLGQGTYRKQMLELWEGKCAVTSLTIQSALIASHAKPWADSTDDERLDPCNGLPLMATLDRLFDKHLITFDPETGKMLISHRVEETDRAILGIPANLRKILNDQQASYLKLHLDEFELHNVR
ncbi:hypothetical protein PS862_03695 [Pseudomonas fluorescens]|uniref:HNH nuclease domain-containing protein n=1 Tax=Pseudomonas fluorescens TaxID=294 RepID=A0A5E7LVX1_PSEFL|nr:HNH endonuclease signature motif containing protein [Pseudomonas fluorescens]VVP17829.1 hypothetical protein PS862_03695 [Pseudomonas fluorescens]